MRPGEEHRIPTRVGTLAVRVIGEGSPAVLWHSLFVDDRSWRRVEERLARDRRLVIITGPGHGASTDPGHRYSLDDCAAAAGEVLAALDIQRARGLGRQCVGRARGHRVRGDLAGPMPDPGHVRHAGPGLWPIAAAPVSGPARGLPRHRDGGLPLERDPRRPVVAQRLARTIRRRSPWCSTALRTMERRALANAMVSISLGRPDLTSASRRSAARPCSSPAPIIRSGRPTRRKRRAGCSPMAQRPSSPTRRT